MSNKIEIQKKPLPTIQELYADDSIELVVELDNFNVILNQPPPSSWVKVHPYVKGYKYLPIDKTEWLLRRIFKRYKIEITGQGQSFNGVWVTVRVNYFHPILKEWMFHDGIGAIHLQVKSGSSPADLANINNGALSMAFPLAKTLAVKDACDHFGDAFGSNLNRKDIMPTNQDERLHEVAEKKKTELKKRVDHFIKSAIDKNELDALRHYLLEFPELQEQFENKEKQLNNEK